MIGLKTRLVSLLRWSERYAHTDMVYLARGSTWTIIGQIIAAACVFILGVAFANLVEKETYGTYRYILTIAGVFSIFTLPGLSSALTRSVARGATGGLTEATLLRVKGGAIGTMLAASASVAYLILGENSIALCFLIIAVFLPFFDTFTTYAAYLQGKQKFYLRFILAAITQVGSAVIILITILFTKSVFLLLLAYFGAYSLLRLLCWIFVRATSSQTREDSAETLRYGKHLSAINVLSTIASQADTILLYYFLGPVQVAVYAIATSLPLQVTTLFKGFAEVVTPKLANRTVQELNLSLPLRILQLMLAGLAASLTYIAISPFIFKLFFPEYLDSLFYSQLLSLTFVIAVPVTYVGMLFQTHPSTLKEAYLVNIVPNVALLTLLVLLASTYGIAGALAARAGFYAIGLVFGSLLWRRAARATPPRTP